MRDETTDRNRSWPQAPSLKEIGGLLPQYEMVSFLAQGGMSAVYLARQRSLDRLVAIKVLPPKWGTAEEFDKHFQFEARAMATLQHNGIVAIHDFGQTSKGYFYLVMEYVEGDTLHQLIRTRRVQESQARDLALQLCDAVAYAHARGILHRDIKPGNILVTTEGLAKLTDFGLARPTGASVEHFSLGTPGYSAPELKQHGALVDHRADIYALGVVFHKMLTGMRIEEPRLPLSAYGDFDPVWEPALVKATAARSCDRFDSVMELREALGFPPGTLTAVVYLRAPEPAVPESPATEKTPHPALPDAPVSSLKWMLPFLLSFVVIGAGLLFLETNGRETPPSPPVGSLSGQSHGLDAAAGVFRVPDGLPGHAFAMEGGHHGTVRSVLVMPDQVRAASCGDDGCVLLWDLRTRSVARQFGPVDAGLEHLAVSPDGRHLAASGDDRRVYLWDTGGGTRPQSNMQSGMGAITGIAFQPGGGALIVACEDGGESLIRWDWQRGGREALSGWKEPVTALAFLHGGNGDGFVTGGMQNDHSDKMQLRLGSVAKRKAVKDLLSIKADAGPLALSPDGTLAALRCSNRMVVADLPGGVRLSETGNVSAGTDRCAFVDGGWLLLTGGDGRLHLWESTTGREVWQSEAVGGGAAFAMAVSKDDSFVVSNGESTGDGFGAAQGGHSLHVWRLPALASLRSPAGARIESLCQLLRVVESDRELAVRITQFTEEWNESVVKASAAARQEVEDRYTSSLRSALSAEPSGSRPAYADELARMRRGEPPPPFSHPGWPALLVQHFHEYVAMSGELPVRAAAARARTVAGQSTRLDELEQARRDSGDPGGVLRVSLLKEALASLNGEMDWEKLKGALRASLPPALVPRAAALASRSASNALSGSRIAPMRGAPVLNRPAHSGRLLIWKRGSAFGPTQTVLLDCAPDLSDVVALSAGSNHALALRVDGTVVAWGLRAGGESASVPTGLDHVVAVAAGAGFDLALREDGSVVAWSSGVVHALPEGMKPAVGIHNGVIWGFARHADGSVTRLPVGSVTQESANPPAMLGPVTDLAVGASDVLALTREGRLVGWGKETPRLPEIPSGKNSDIISVALNHMEAAALRRDGELVVTGAAWRVENFKSNRLTGADRVVRCWPEGAFAVHYPGDRWELIVSGTAKGGDASMAEKLRGCIDVAAGQYCVMGIKP